MTDEVLVIGRIIPISHTGRPTVELPSSQVHVLLTEIFELRRRITNLEMEIHRLTTKPDAVGNDAVELLLRMFPDGQLTFNPEMRQ